MQITAESKRWVQKKSKLICRLSRYCRLKVVKKVKNAQRSGPLEKDRKSTRRNFSHLGNMYEITSERKRRVQKKRKLICRLSRYCRLKVVKKVKNAQRS